MAPNPINPMRLVLGAYLVFLLCQPAVASTNLQECYNLLRNGTWGSQGAVDSRGNPVTDLTQAAGFTFQACEANCGSGSEPFNWHGFTQKSTAWLLPYLALISQLPYGANDPLSNSEAFLLNVGSPMLAAYSLLLAVIGNRWMVRRFRRSNHPNTFFAATVMGGFQQVFLSLPRDNLVLPSLIMLRDNDGWWRSLAHGLELSGSRWTLAAILSMVFVAIAYLFTWVDTIECNLNTQASCSGQSYGSLWLCLLPIVICNLQLSPKTNVNQVNRALDLANQSVFLATETSQPEQLHGSETFVIERSCRDAVYEDVVCPTPICFYSRFIGWFQAARRMTDAFDAASQWMSDPESNPSLITKEGIIDHCTLDPDYDDYNVHSYDLLSIVTKAIFLAAFLQWGTIGAAIMSHYLTPTKGLGCRSGSYLLYGCLSTLVWLFLFISSILTHIYSAFGDRWDWSSRRLISVLAIFTRLAGKTIAALNVAWVFTFTFFQFSNAYNSCYCDGSVLGLGSDAYVVLAFTADQMKAVRVYWTGGMIMASATALFFIIVTNLLKQRPEPLHYPLEQNIRQYGTHIL